MPLYEYECQACHHRFELIQKMGARRIKKCPRCGKPRVVRLLSSPAIQFKGTGWYVTDYKGKGSGPAPSEKSGAEKKDSGSSEKGSGDKGSGDKGPGDKGSGDKGSGDRESKAGKGKSGRKD